MFYFVGRTDGGIDELEMLEAIVFRFATSYSRADHRPLKFEASIWTK